MQGVELLQKGLGMFEDKALRAQPFHLLRITGHRTRDDEHLFDMLNLIFLSAYRSLAQTTGANGFRDEAWIIYEKAHETVKRMGESGMHKRDKLTYHGISYEFLNEMVRAAVAKVGIKDERYMDICIYIFPRHGGCESSCLTPCSITFALFTRQGDHATAYEMSTVNEKVGHAFEHSHFHIEPRAYGC